MARLRCDIVKNGGLPRELLYAFRVPPETVCAVQLSITYYGEIGWVVLWDILGGTCGVRIVEKCCGLDGAFCRNECAGPADSAGCLGAFCRLAGLIWPFNVWHVQ